MRFNNYPSTCSAIFKLANKILLAASVALPIGLMGSAFAQQATTPQNDISDTSVSDQFDIPIPQPKFTDSSSANDPDDQFDIDTQSSNASSQPLSKPNSNSKNGQQNIGLSDAQNRAQNLADAFSKTRVMMGEFIQFDARNNMTRGRFFLQRPGKILFDYKNAPLRVISDGRSIAVNNRRINSWNLYQLNKSPLNLLLADKINISNGRLLEFTQSDEKITLVLGDTTGRSKIALEFDPKTSQLVQWTMTDNGQKTVIQLFNTRTDIEFPKNMFDINYYRYPKKR